MKQPLDPYKSFYESPSKLEKLCHIGIAYTAGMVLGLTICVLIISYSNH